MNYGLLNLLRSAPYNPVLQATATKGKVAATKEAFAVTPMTDAREICRDAHDEAFAINKHRSMVPARRRVG